jgi:hypothetical protein
LDIDSSLGARLHGEPPLELNGPTLTFELRALFAEKGSLLPFDSEDQKKTFKAWCRANAFENVIRTWELGGFL